MSKCKWTIEKLTLEDFHTFYLGSFVASNIRIMRDAEQARYIEVMESFARKLLAVTKKAICIELFDFASARGLGVDQIIKDVHGDVVKFKTDCENGDLPFACAAQVFRKGDWCTSYGGAPWAEITRTAQCIKGSLPITHKTVGNFMVQVDHLVDLWHNTAAVLGPYVDFNLERFLDVKTADYNAEDFDKASSFMKTLFSRWGVGRNVIKSGRR